MPNLSPKKNGRENRKKRVFFSPNVLVPLLLAALFLVIVIASCSTRVEEPAPAASSEKTETKTEAPDETVPPPPPTTTLPHAEYTASLGVTGDILIHNPILWAYENADGSYDFDPIYEPVKPYFSRYDLMIANLEVTLGGPEAGKYSGYPSFNCPDSMVDSLTEAGVDLLLTANNHSYDTGTNGFHRTQKVLQEKNVPYIGTRPDTDSSFVKVMDLGGVKVGLTCYTYETGGGEWYKKSLNGIPMRGNDDELIHSFNYNNLNAFYELAAKDLEEMKALGADFSVFFVHWGNEYQFKPNSFQTQMAEKLCELGVDVIVGGHPHVIQPYDTLTSSDGAHQTLCLYSMGNMISNQNHVEMSSEPSGHTEDGVIFGVTFEKWTDGSVKISDLEILPLWVDRQRRPNTRFYDYRVIPLDVSVSDWSAAYQVNADDAKRSYKRTMELVGEGLNAYRASIGRELVPLTAQ